MSETPLSCSENLHLQLCVNDLLHPTEKSEILLEALTATQLDEIERTLNKIKIKKQSSPNQVATTTPPVITNPLLMNHDWTKVAAQIAKALANTISSSAAQASKLKLTKPPSPIMAKVTGTASDKNPSSSTQATKTTTINTSTIADDSADIVDATETVDITTTATTTTTTTTTTVMATEDDGSITSGPPSPAPITNHELRTEMRDGVEWVSFVYSHHRILRRYSIRTDIKHVDLNQLEESFKIENCVYPRANLPREEYKGNRWAYETECNTLGWKLAYLNTTEIAGKRGLIQRAVDSYRNRYPSMRSRRVARQEKLLKGTLRKRKQRDSEEPEEEEHCTSKKSDHDLPKTVSIDDGLGHSKCRIRINVDSVSLDSIDMEFRMANCVYPRAVEINTNSPFASQRQLEEIRCNELAWKLAWLNPKQLANRKSLLQRVLDVYRSKFMPELNPRRKDSLCGITVLTVDALASRKSKQKMARRKSNDDEESQHSGTTDSLDSCLSPALTDSYHDGKCAYKKTVSLNDLMLPGLTTASCANGLAFEAQSIFESPGDGGDSCRLSISSSSSSSSTESNVSSPNKDPMDIDDSSFKDYSSMFDLYTDPSAICEYDQNEHIKIEKDYTMPDSTMTPLF
ncbi:hypothetical protein CU098_013722 [Rhizopus stolonifer]|uniref:DUF8032 domain-containing protein n=1 Tax=Rhizopus stolonifer TaxID=4846 RepID=A0A367KXD6_RHIST|nr:hypothetical protein CU098_013722 [Rhizopus stolonifer]